MPIPNTEDLYVPLLSLAGDGKDWSLPEARRALAGKFALTEQELAQRHPNGSQLIFGNRVSWAMIHLQKAGLLMSPKPAGFRITEMGRKTLAKGSVDLLSSSPKQLLKTASTLNDASSVGPGGGTGEPLSEPPEEVIEKAYEQINSALADALLSYVKSRSPTFFERLVLMLLQKMGYGKFRETAGATTSAGADGGIDGVIHEDFLGLERVYLQAKRWEAPVGRPEIQKFVGALHGLGARKGVFITTSSFTAEARGYASHTGMQVVLIDGSELVRYMIDLDVGVATRDVYRLKQVDTDFFDE